MYIEVDADQVIRVVENMDYVDMHGWQVEKLDSLLDMAITVGCMTGKVLIDRDTHDLIKEELRAI